MTVPGPLLEMTGVCRSFASPAGMVSVLNDIDISVPAGEFVMVTGPSGSGKSTFLNLAALLDRPTTGGVRFCGRDVGTLEESALCSIRAREIGMVFQKFHLLLDRTVLENVVFRWRYLGGEGDEGVRAGALRALEEVGLAALAGRRCRVLSAGEMQRVVIARAIAVRPRLLVADEPTGNLDRFSAETIMACFERLHAGGITVLMVTHNESLLHHATRHLFCRAGTLVEGDRR